MGSYEEPRAPRGLIDLYVAVSINEGPFFVSVPAIEPSYLGSILWPLIFGKSYMSCCQNSLSTLRV